MSAVVPLVYTVRIPFLAKGKRFARGDVLTAEEAGALKLNQLVSMGRLHAAPGTSAAKPPSDSVEPESDAPAP